MEREKKIVRTSILGIVTNVLLVIFKALVGFFTNSIAIILDALNNLTDVVSSVVTIVGTKLAGKAPDKEHPYGHGRIEYIASLLVSEIILLAGVIAIKESFEKIINPEEIDYSIISIVIISVAVVVKYVLGRHVKKRGRDLNSQSLVASGQDAYMDAVLGFTTFVAAVINYVWHLSIEGYLGIIIGIVIIKSAIDILRETVTLMIGGRAEEEITKTLREKIATYKEVQGVYDLTVHNYGPSYKIATAHIQVRDDMRADEIHILTRQIIMDVYNEYGILLTIGIYAANNKESYQDIKIKIAEIVNKYSEVKQAHGFYVDEKEKQAYVDLIIEFECKDREGLKDNIVHELEEAFPEYKFNVIIDDDFSD